MTLSAPDALQFLRSHGIKPEIRGSDLVFKKPRGKRGKQFMRELYSRYKPARPACMSCDGTEDVCLVKCECGAVGTFCIGCLKSGRSEACPHTGG
jgi:hypothetical protein